MVVYIHMEQGRLTYLSGRSIEGKKHYNPPRDIIGERQPSYNHLYNPQVEQVVIVEGQADAITFTEWGIAAVAIGGMQAADELLNCLKAHPRLFVALDNTDDARAKSRSLALTLKGETYLPTLPGDVKDVNEWLQRDATSDAAEWDEQISEGKSLSEREEAVLQALEIITCNQPEWIKATDLREQVQALLSYTKEQMGHAQWIGHILNRVQLVDRNRRKAYTGGQMYSVKREEVLDIMRRYNVSAIER